MFTPLSIRSCRTAYMQAFGQTRHASSKRWQARQQKDQFTKEAAVQGLKSRAAFKLLQVQHYYIQFA
jgi:21S rRNA (uridine2791-2'-O)-methyltransferase